MTMLFGHGGIEGYMLNVFDHIDRSQYAIDVALPGEYKQQNEDALVERGIKVIHYPANSIGQQIREIKQILNDGNYDIVHIMQSYVTLETYAVFALVSIAEKKHHHYKVICHSHGTEDTTKPISPVKKALRTLYRTVLRKGFSKADLLVGCSREAGEFLYGKGADIDVFHNGIKLDKFLRTYTDFDLLSLCQKYNIKRDKLNFVTVSRMSEEKNPLFILDIVKRLSQQYPNFIFSWIGDGDLLDDITAKINKEGLGEHVQLLGKSDSVEEILACCDYFLMPSKREGAPLSLIEAQAAGLYCFVSDRVPNEVDCGGISFIPLDKTADQWASEIHNIIENKSTTKINMDLLHRFDVNVTVAALANVYDKLLEAE